MFRSNMDPAITKGAWEDRSPGHDIREEQDYGQLRKMIKQWRQVAPKYLGDYYPLTPYSSKKTDTWIAWQQYNRPELGEGVVHAFRRPGNNSPSEQHLRLKGLDPDATYTLTDFDNPETSSQSGRKIMERGLEVRLPKSPGAALIAYRLNQ